MDFFLFWVTFFSFFAHAVIFSLWIIHGRDSEFFFFFEVYWVLFWQKVKDRSHSFCGCLLELLYFHFAFNPKTYSLFLRIWFHSPYSGKPRYFPYNLWELNLNSVSTALGDYQNFWLGLWLSSCLLDRVPWHLIILHMCI